MALNFFRGKWKREVNEGVVKNNQSTGDRQGRYVLSGYPYRTPQFTTKLIIYVIQL